MTTRWFGERVERREDERLVRGAGRFLDDAGHDALARGEVNHVGEPVAMVVADDRSERPSTWSIPTFPGTWPR